MAETTAANPELLADQISQLLVQPLEATSVVLASGPRIFDTSGVLRIPKLVSGATAGFIGECSEIPATADVDFDELILMPTDGKSLKTILTFTNELVRQSVIGIDAVLRAPLVKDVSDALDTALLTGDGSSDSITGIVEQANTIAATLDVTDHILPISRETFRDNV
jgi:HK97 family phage major capsid protein